MKSNKKKRYKERREGWRLIDNKGKGWSNDKKGEDWGLYRIFKLENRVESEEES